MLYNAIQRKILKTSLSEKCRERLIKGLQSVNRKTQHKEINKRELFEKLCMKFLNLAQNFLNEMDLSAFTEALQLIGKLLLEISPLHTSYHNVIIKTRIASLKLHSLHIVPNILNKTKLVKISLQRAQCFAQQLNSCPYLPQIKKDYYSSLEMLYMNLMIFNVLFLNYEVSMKYLQKAKQTLKLQILDLNQFMYLEDRKVFQLIKEKTYRMEQIYCFDYYIKRKMGVIIKKEQLKASHSFFDHILSTFEPQKNMEAIEELIFKKAKSSFPNNLKTNCFDEQLQRQCGYMSKHDQQSAGDVSFILSVNNENYLKIMQQIIPLRDLRDIERKKTQTSYVSSEFVPTQKQLNNQSLDKRLQKRNNRNYSLNVFRPSLIKQLIDFSNKQQYSKQQQKNIKIQQLKLANKRRISMFSKIRDQQIKYYQNVNPFTIQNKQKISKTQITSSDSSQKKSNGVIFCPALVSNSKKELKLSQSKKKNQKVRISLAVPPSSSIVRLVTLPNKTYCFNPIMQQENNVTILNQKKKQKFKASVSKMLLQSWKFRCQMIQLKRIQLCNGWPYWYKIQGQYIKCFIFGYRQYIYIRKNIKFPFEILKKKINQKFQRRCTYSKKVVNAIQNLEKTEEQSQHSSEKYAITNIESNFKKPKKTSVIDVILLWIRMLCHKKTKNNFSIIKIDNRIHICQYTIKSDNTVQFFITTNNTKKIKYIFKAKFINTLSETIEKSLKQLFDKSINPIQRWLSVTETVVQHTTFRVFFMEKYTEKVYKYDKKFYRVACIQYNDKKLILMYEYKGTCTYLYFLQPQEDFNLKSLQKKKIFMQKFDNYKLIRKQNTIYLQLSTNMNKYIINLKTSEKQIKPLQKLHIKNTL